MLSLRAYPGVRLSWHLWFHQREAQLSWFSTARNRTSRKVSDGFVRARCKLNQIEEDDPRQKGEPGSGHTAPLTRSIIAVQKAFREILTVLISLESNRTMRFSPDSTASLDQKRLPTNS